MMAFLRNPWVIRLCQVAVGLCLVYYALPKIGDTGSFAIQIHNYQLMPIALENLFAMILPWVELVAGVALIVGLRARAAAWLGVLMMLMFIAAIAWALHLGLNINCGCGGTADGSRVGIKKILEDVGWLVLAWVGTLRPGRG